MQGLARLIHALLPPARSPQDQTPPHPGTCTRPSHTEAAPASGAPIGARAAPRLEAATPRQRSMWDTSSPPCSLHAATQANTRERRTPRGHWTRDAWPRPRHARSNHRCTTSQAAAHGGSGRTPLLQARRCGEQPARQATSLPLAAAHTGLVRCTPGLQAALPGPRACTDGPATSRAEQSPRGRAVRRGAAGAQQQLDLLVFTDLPSPGRIVLPGLFRTGWLAILRAVREAASIG